jgi:hypothetical protein
MKNANCHNDKMEAYCNAVRALKDKFYGVELNHVPHRYNEEANELAKITSEGITVCRNVFAQDVAKPSVNLEPTPSSQEEPSGAPLNLASVEPMDEDPSNEAFVLSLLEGYGVDEVEAMDTEPAPRVEDWRATSPGWIDGSFPRTNLRPDTSPGWPNRSPSLTASSTSAPRQASCSATCLSPRGASASETSTRACVATTRRRAPSWVTRSARASTGLPRLLTLERSCAPAKGANFTPC